MKRSPAVTPARVLVPVSIALLCGCTSIGNFLSGDKADYRTQGGKAKPLDVPPDLTQLARDNRYAPQGGVVSASATPGPAALPATAATIAPLAAGDLRVERDGTQRWLVVPLPPEQVWPQVKAFWQERGFAIASESAETGVMETDWAENRNKLPNDLIRSTLGRVLGNLYDTGERDRFRTRIERTAAGSEVYISHRGLEEVYTDERKDSTQWRPRAQDPQLEAEFLTRLMVRLGAKEEVARTTVAAAPQAPARARSVAGSGAALEIDEPFDRAWRRVGLALDRSGFTVEDRDRTGGLYFVRYVDPKSVNKEEPGFFGRMFSWFGSKKDGPSGPLRYRIAVKSSGEKTLISVLTSNGAPEPGENAQRIVSQLITELR